MTAPPVAAKVVRGAYLVSEAERAAERGLPSPLHPDKAATDAAYDGAVVQLIEAVARTGLAAVVVATHNARSVERAAVVGFGRIVVSEVEVPNMFVNLASSG
jgi:hypothetical protein